MTDPSRPPVPIAEVAQSENVEETVAPTEEVVEEAAPEDRAEASEVVTAITDPENDDIIERLKGDD
ncbi:hypothetical protein [Salana multivorans]